MAVSRIDIANMALLKLGQPPIMSLTDNSVIARRVSQEIEPALETVLRAYPWPFAVKRVELPRLLERPVYQFAYYYQMPSDLIRLISLHIHATAYDLEGDKLATDAETAHIKYVSRDAALDAMDMATRDVIALNLAARLSTIVTENQQLQRQLWQMYDIQMAQARNVWAIEDMPQSVLEGGWIPARYGARNADSIAETFNPWGPDGTGVSNG